MENQDLKETVLLNLRSVTQSCKGGVPFERLQRDYRDLLGAPIPFRDLGFNSLEAFIRDIPHVIALRKNHDGQLMAEGVADASTAHIVSLVSRQKGESKKRGFRKPPPHFGMRKTLSSRFTFREGPRGGHSHYNSAPQYNPKFSKSPPKPSSYSKPAPKNSNIVDTQRRVSHAENSNIPTQTRVSHSKPPVVEQPAEHSKPRPSYSQVPKRGYEIAPRFLKKQNQDRNISPPSQELSCSSPAHRPPSPPDNISSGIDAIPPPRPVMRPLPSRPQQMLSSFKPQTNSLESANSAKEYVNIYSEMNNLSAVYTTVHFGQKAKNKGYVSTLTLGDKKYQSYPELKPTKDLAEEEAAKKAMTALKDKMKEGMTTYPETPYGNAEEIRKLLSKIEEIVCEKPSGMYENGIVREYENKFNERLPECWLELLRQSSYLEIDEVALSNVKVPKGANFIVRPTKELSSGNHTPSSTSSKTDFAYEENLDSSTLQKNLVKISQPKVPDFKLPDGNEWGVFVTTVCELFAVRFLDYNDEFLALSNEMATFYETRNFPVSEVCEYQVYAACVDDIDIWHRVLVDESKEDGQIYCYLVDEGDFIYVEKENLQEMNPSFLNLPFQAIHISLNGLEEYENCISYELLEQGILGKTLIAEVKRCNQIPDFFPEIRGVHRTIYSVNLYDTSDSSGEDLNLNEWLKQAVKESLVCKLPKLLTTSCAYLSHVTADGLIYLRFTNPQQCWIEEELEKSAPFFEVAASTGMKITLNKMCVAKHESGTWHRATITDSLSSDPEMIEVLFVDHGHVALVGNTEICDLEPVSELLASIPPQAIRCELLNALPSPTAQWTEATTIKLLELAPSDQELIIRVMSEGDEQILAKVNLYKRNKDSNIISINDSLACNPSFFKEESARPIVKAPSKLALPPRRSSSKNTLSNAIPDVAVPAEEQMAKRLVASVSSEELKWLNTPDDIKSPGALDVQSPVSLCLPVIPDKGRYFDVFVTMAAHPHNFVIQPFELYQELDKLMKDIQNFYSADENQFEMDISVLRKNDYYAALHTDGLWYRVRIDKIIPSDPAMVVAYYVDFGDFNPISINNLQPLYQKFKVLPCQAIQASLYGVKPFESDWDPVHCVKFREMVTEKTFVSIVKEKHNNIKDDIPTPLVELILIDTTDPQKDVFIHELLIEREMAQSS